MKSVIKRPIVIAGNKMSRVSLEDAFWSALNEITGGCDTTLSDPITIIDADRQRDLSSAIRLFVLGIYRDQLASHDQISSRQSRTLEQGDAADQMAGQLWGRGVGWALALGLPWLCALLLKHNSLVKVCNLQPQAIHGPKHLILALFLGEMLRGSEVSGAGRFYIAGPGCRPGWCHAIAQRRLHRLGLAGLVDATSSANPGFVSAKGSARNRRRNFENFQRRSTVLG